MATGERTWSTQGKEAKKFEGFKPIPPGEYELKLNNDWAQKVADGEGKVPYLNGSFTALNTGDGGKDRKIFVMFFLDLTPGKDGTAMCERANGLLGFAKALGTNLNVPVVTMNGKELLSPAAVKKFLASNDGSTVRASVKIEKGTGGYADKNRIEFFVESEQQDEESEEISEEVAEEEVAEEGGFPEPEEVEEEAEFEPTPPPKKAAPKPVAKVAAKPAAKKR